MKIKNFEVPQMTVLKLEAENIIRTSGCWEAHDCEKCYNDAVACDIYDCIGLVCDCLGALHI